MDTYSKFIFSSRLLILNNKRKYPVFFEKSFYFIARSIIKNSKFEKISCVKHRKRDFGRHFFCKCFAIVLLELFKLHLLPYRKIDPRAVCVYVRERVSVERLRAFSSRASNKWRDEWCRRAVGSCCSVSGCSFRTNTTAH